MSPDSTPLSPRECELIPLVAKGLRNKQIALAMNLTEGTVKEYLNRIFRKLRVGTRTELAVWYIASLHQPTEGASRT